MKINMRDLMVLVLTTTAAVSIAFSIFSPEVIDKIFHISQAILMVTICNGMKN